MYLVIAKYVAIAAVVLGVGYLGYEKIYTAGYNSAANKYQKQIDDYNDRLRDRINNIELNSAVLLEQYSKNKEMSSKQFKDILAAARTKPLVVYQNGNCEITPDFAKAYTEALKRANKK